MKIKTNDKPKKLDSPQSGSFAKTSKFKNESKADSDSLYFPPLGMGKRDGFAAIFALTMKFFPDNDQQHVRADCRAVFDLWRPLIQRATEISICFMIGNGEQIYRWMGNMDDEFEWDHYKGHNNVLLGYGTKNFGIPLRDFKENWFHFTYHDLKNIIQWTRETAVEMFGLPVRASTIVEPGGEFCESLFRYTWHPEIVTHMGGGHGMSIDYKSALHADARSYGAYPGGIPEGEFFARFLGKQVAHFCRSMDIQDVFFLNGLGFGTHPWSIVGRNFDGKRFGLAKYADLAKDILDFWIRYKNEAPMQKVMAMGSNWPVGVDLAAKGVPLKDIYDRRLLDLPLGYALSVFWLGSLGFGMASGLSRIAHAPSWDLNFYLHDPWYPQNPWEDYPYDRQPFDLYSQASISLVGANGVLIKPCSFQIAAIHDENGNIQPETARSFMPHLETVLSQFPDRIGPLTWLYPFDEYHQIMAEHPDWANEVWFGDAFTGMAIDAGLPLNSVISTRNLAAALKTGVLADTILYTPTPIEGASYLPHLWQWIKAGGKVLIYGPLDHADLSVLQLLGLELSEPMKGELEFHWQRMDVIFEAMRPGTPIVKHNSVTSGGGVREVHVTGANSEMLATVAAGGATRAYAVGARNGQLVWCRGTLPLDINDDGGLVNHDINHYVNGARVPRLLLAIMGCQIGHALMTPGQRDPQMFMSRHRNGWFFSGCKLDNTVEYALRLPDGAPIFTGDDTCLCNGLARYHMDKTFHKECRVFVDQSDGFISCRKRCNAEFSESEISIRGLRDATVTLFLPLDKIAGAGIWRLPAGPERWGYRRTDDGFIDAINIRYGDKLIIEQITGTIIVRW
ncbi:MAG: hypothetical protein PHV34_21475 [Verrucomicrobiae bacterium]|nr:hypothetical protein [Verrucomicrobiae bacterium]